MEGVFSELRPYEDEHGVTVVGGCLTLRLAYRARRVPRNAGGHRAPVGLLVRAEAAGEGGFLVPADEPRDDQPGKPGVQQQPEPAQEQRLACDGRQHRHVHGVADVAIHPANDQTLGRGNRRRCPEALHDVTHEPRTTAISPATRGIPPSPARARPRALDDSKARLARRPNAEGEHSVEEICSMLGVGRSSLYGYLAEDDADGKKTQP